MSAPNRSPTVTIARPPRWDSRRRADTDETNTATSSPAPDTEAAPLTVDKVNLAQKLALFSEH